MAHTSLYTSQYACHSWAPRVQAAGRYRLDGRGRFVVVSDSCWLRVLVTLVNGVPGVRPWDDAGECTHTTLSESEKRWRASQLPVMRVCDSQCSSIRDLFSNSSFWAQSRPACDIALSGLSRHADVSRLSWDDKVVEADDKI